MFLLLPVSAKVSTSLRWRSFDCSMSRGRGGGGGGVLSYLTFMGRNGQSSSKAEDQSLQMALNLLYFPRAGGRHSVCPAEKSNSLWA